MRTKVQVNEAVRNLASSFADTSEIEQEGIFHSRFPQRFEASAGPGMTRFHIAIQQKRVVVALHLPKSGDPLGRFPILHLAVVQSCGHEHGRIVLLPNVVVRAIGTHISISSRVIRIAPFVVFPCG